MWTALKPLLILSLVIVLFAVVTVAVLLVSAYGSKWLPVATHPTVFSER